MNLISARISSILILLSIFFHAAPAGAFSLDTYADASALSSGRWIKVSVKESGIHFISASTLRSWGFSDISKVCVHGYGGQKLPDYMTRASYVDDLPQIPALRTQSGIYFHAQGPVTWEYRRSHYMQSINPYSTEGFYFITQSDGADEPAAISSDGQYVESAQPQTTFVDYVYHETERNTLSHSGQSLYGEDFRYTRSRSFRLSTPDCVTDADAWVSVTFVGAVRSESKVQVSVNGTPLPRELTIRPNVDNYGYSGTLASTFNPSGNSAEVGITFNPSGIVDGAFLDKITVNYSRRIALSSGILAFNAASTTVALEGATAATHVWDVTDPRHPFELNTTLVGDRLCWTNPYTGQRDYVAWNESAVRLSPQMVSSVPNQNLHGITDTPDMIIITVDDLAGEAERLAALHRRAPESLNVLVVPQSKIFNEFASGARDPNAFRKMLKMFYDRGNKAGHPLRYLILMGHPVFDNRGLTPDAPASLSSVMPSWQTSESLSQGTSITSDDVFGILGDNTGSLFQADVISIAVGRIPARNLSQAKAYVDKLYAYVDNAPSGEWKNSIVLEADNGNAGVFMDGLESMQKNMLASPDAAAFTYNKVYIDAFPIQGGICVKGRERFYRLLDEGLLWWIYNGHGAIQTLCGEGMHSRTDLNSMYNKHWPVLLASTCSFAQWDMHETSGAETLAFNSTGGTIAVISPARKAYITDNNVIIPVYGSYLMKRDADGRYLPIGEMLRQAKNDSNVRNTSSVARTRMSYVLLGDPAMRLTVPSATVSLESVNGNDFIPSPSDSAGDDADDCVLMARQRVRLEGSVRNPDGSEMSDFNGSLTVTLYDSEFSTTSSGLVVDDTGAKAVTFEEMGNKLLSGRGVVKNGRFQADIVMPSEIADNYRPALLNLYALADDGRDAVGCTRNLYVYGTDDLAAPDTIAPLIDYAYLNHSSFTDGSVINEQPMFIAGVSDDVAINMSMAGIGHQMLLKLDDRQSFTDISLYYTPAADGSPSGTIAYPMSELSPGNHNLTFRVWDTDGNSASRTLSFFVEPGAAPQIFDIFTDVNPASTHANFYISHNRPDAAAEVSLEIYSMSGRRVWTSMVSGRSDMFLSTPIQWDLCDSGGARVPRGIYIYRATIKIDGHELQTSAKRIAVTGN